MNNNISESVDESKLWVLHYRHGPNPTPMWKTFSHSGSLPEVITRAKEHCTVMNTRFVGVRPFLTNLAEEEKKQSMEQ